MEEFGFTPKEGYRITLEWVIRHGSSVPRVMVRDGENIVYGYAPFGNSVEDARKVAREFVAGTKRYW